LTLQAGVNNLSSVASGVSQADPFATPSVQFAVTQPLLRGFGIGVNRREIRVAQNDRRISRLLFQQQLIEVVYGVARLYYDLVSLDEDVKVKQDALAAARKLSEDDQAQVQAGTLAPIELLRAQALVAASELDLVRAQGFLSQQEVILKTQLARRGSADPAFKSAHILPSTVIDVPAAEELAPLDNLITQALGNRPDVGQAILQITNGEITLEGSRNQTLPQLDLIGDAQTRGSLFASDVTGSSSRQITTGLNTVTTTTVGTIYEAGIQLDLPIRNRIARSDAARDALQLRQMQDRLQQLKNQVREEVESAQLALQMARAAYDAAVKSRVYQQQLLQAEKDRFSVGASTNFLIVQDQSFLAQAFSSEVAARSAYVKAKLSLQRAVGMVLEENHVDVDDATRK
jgi:outer membrane protein